MDRRVWFGPVMLTMCYALGCGSSSNDAAKLSETDTTAGTASANAPLAAKDPISQAAHDFLTAVIEGDTERATGKLTPLALEKIRAGGKAFAPPGLETASFRIGQIKQPNPSQALVQCVLTDNSPAGQPLEEEMCCMMRLVNDQWLVSGIAYQVSPDKPPLIIDFENPQRTRVLSQQMATQQNANANGSAATPRYAPSPPVGNTEPPRTALDPAAGTAR